MKTCLIGTDINYSLSPAVHRELGDCSYSVINLKENELKALFASREYDGFNVTVPYKEKAISFIDVLDETAEKVGAVNTVVLKDGMYFGYNTDVYGFEALLERNGIEVYGKSVMVLGSGGAAKSVRFVLDKEGAQIINVSRTGSVNYSNLYEYSPAIIINATPVGNVNNFSALIDLKNFPDLECVIDLSYNPIIPRLLIDAGNLGVKAVSGLEMLVSQAIESHNLIFGERTDIRPDDILPELIGKLRNIVLIGMPGTGKTTIGRALAERIGYSFIDTDEEIEKKGRKINDIFAENGEEYFRNLETGIIKEFALKNNYVISCGGGAILNKDNMDYLMANGVIISLIRDVKISDIPDRPLIKSGEDIKRLSEERKPLYDKYASVTVENNSSVEECVDKIKSMLCRTEK